MSKLPAKQIYLLLIIVLGIVTLSVYSTYSIFTYESETSDIVNLHTPNTLAVYTNVYEYKRITVPKNSSLTTDIDIYNTFNYELCYSIWYKVATKKADSNKVKIYEQTNENITTSGMLENLESKRVKLLIINDNNQDVIINVGVSTSENNGTCELNISEDKSIITSTINSNQKLSEYLIKNNNQKNNNQSGYLTYKNITEKIELDNEMIKVSTSFSHKDEVFTLNNPEEVLLNNITKYESNNTTSYYICLNEEKCTSLYKINKIEISNDNKYILSNYDYLFGYQSGESGIRNVNNNYYYYGDNPNNFIYYNCTNEQDNKTCELWRILGTYKQEDNTYITKIVKSNPITKIKYSEYTDNLWNNSSIKDYLNNEYKLKSTNIVENNFKNQENILTLDSNLLDIKLLETNKNNISIISLTDYLNSSSCQKETISDYNSECLNDNWLNISKDDVNEWTNSIKNEETSTDELTGLTIIPENNKVYSVGSTINETVMTEELNIRPVVYLKERTFLIDGNGTIDNPYIIK